jgi:DNA (cytosine-5)-methyltransferase 1
MVPHHRGVPARPPRHPASPDGADLSGVRRFIKRSRSRPTAVDLFCGAGGLSVGLERAGFDVLVGADSDEWAVRTHDTNLPGLSWCGDLSDPTEFLSALDVWGVERVDLVAGGVPCQPFSRAGASKLRDLIDLGERVAHDHRADLWSSFVTVVDRLKPAAVLVENVPDLPRWNDGAVIINLYESLLALGYRVEARIVDGFRHGVPQHRQRLILLGIDGRRLPLWPDPVGELVTLRDAIGDLPPIPRAQRSEQLPYDARRQTAEYQPLMRRDVPPEFEDVVLEHICRDVRSDDMEAFRILTEGQTYIDLPERLRRYRSDVFTDKYKRLHWGELCRSITAHIAKDGYWYIHPDQHRTLSIREAARVQSFPDDFRFAGSQTHRYRQIGNAVPVLLAEAVGASVIRALERPRQVGVDAQAERFRDLLLTWRRTSDAWTPPWRGTRDAWLVLAAELLLTRARRQDAERIFENLIRVAPSPSALLEHDRPEQTLIEIGISERAGLLVRIAEDLAEYFDGVVPDDEMMLRLLPGVGDYVCQATLTFGFGRRQVLVDRTTARVVNRISGRADPRRFQQRLDLYRLAGSSGPDAQFNAALLDLGREICRGDRPLCGSCPVRSRCTTGRAAEIQLDLASPTDHEQGSVAA